MRTVVTGSIATDHLLTFPGSFADQLIADQLDRVSLSFLADRLDIRRGGVAANICYGLGLLGLRPVLVGAAGTDFEPYRVHLKEHGVDTDSVHISTDLHTARFVCTTDRRQNQIATFYAGAMAEARTIDLCDVVARVGRLALVVISPDDPQAMLRHTAACRQHDIPFAADPSQQLARLNRAEVRQLVEGARWLFSNEYEAALLQERSGWTADQIRARVGCWITTLGEDGVRLQSADRAPVVIPAVPVEGVVDPTGVGDAFRAGFVAAATRGVPLADAARLGCAIAATALDYIGTQEYRLYRDPLLARLRNAYGIAVPARILPHLRELT
ncbi:carbohydrate kinase family protein [Streptomyces purpurogeneiscleroticus]|uniref:carbohydrate kinase family protein n=1 Tax=Streptomyces purpurogeneiscleroticus TaxID=68259 RepID=UPI001CBAD00D|nr:carbohydrate kinase family protein [Streptomyces purpurogeneiscleroticus]MBZ4018892.1 carbohydrate kinase family protein [Streptomyces purpurogeneiscleroticus]